MAEIHRTTLVPSKLELLARGCRTSAGARRRAASRGCASSGGYRLDDPAGEVGIEVMVVVDESGATPVVYQVPMTYRAAPLDGVQHALIGESEHGVLGHRWFYDAPHDPVFADRLLALLEGEVPAQHQDVSFRLDERVVGTHVSGPAVRLARSRVLTGEQSNTSIVCEVVDAATGAPAEPVIVKVFRTLQEGETPTSSSSRPSPRPARRRSRRRSGTSSAPGSTRCPRPSRAARSPATSPSPSASSPASRTPGGSRCGPPARAPTSPRGPRARRGDRPHPRHPRRGDGHDARGRGERGPLVASVRERARPRPLRGAGAGVVRERDRGGPRPLRRRLVAAAAAGPRGLPPRPGAARRRPRLGGRRLRGRAAAPALRARAPRPRAARRRGDAPLARLRRGLGRARPPGTSARGWVAAGRAAFLAGYAAVTGTDPSTDPVERDVLAGLELDKALYEVVYEARNRPSWLGIPTAAVQRLVDPHGRGTDRKDLA